MPIAAALAAVCDARGMTSADLVRLMYRNHGVPMGTMRNIVEGHVRVPGRDIRDALDEEFAAGVVGVTLRIAEGRCAGYPSPGGTHGSRSDGRSRRAGPGS